MSATTDAALGVVTVSVFGITTSVGPAEATAWGQVFIGLAPAILIIFLIWRVYRLDKQHMECTQNWNKTQEQLALAYRAITSLSVRRKLPPEKDFLEGNFCLGDLEE